MNNTARRDGYSKLVSVDPRWPPPSPLAAAYLLGGHHRGDPLTAGLDARFEQAARKVGGLDAEHVRDLVGNARVLDAGCVVALALGELQVAELQDAGEQAEDLVDLLLFETDCVHGAQRLDELLAVVDTVDARAVVQVAI